MLAIHMKMIALTLAAAATGSLLHIQVPQSLLVADNSRGAGFVLAANTTYADGTYTGPMVDAYWGPVQVQAVVQSGQIVSLKMLAYPSDRRESFIISQQALPLLRNEVVRAQSAKVDIISGATLTSQAFIRSLDAALGKANPSTGI
jgi:uncharacterized protein with FMN-binding domain